MSDPGTGSAQSAESPKGPRSLMGRPELAIVLGVFLVLAILLTSFKVLRIDLYRGDTAGFFQVTENIIDRGAPVTNVTASANDFSFTTGLTTTPAAAYALNPLLPAKDRQINLLAFHAYYILYPIAVLAKVFSAPVTLFAIDACSFLGIVILAYFILRKKAIPIVAAALFCLLIVSHPSWGTGLLWGQFYPDRIYLLLGFLFMYLASERSTKRITLIIAAILCASINERAALMTGVFLLAYIVLFWKNERDRYFKLGLCAALLLYGEFIVKFVITNPYYSTFLPTSASQVIGELQNPVFVHDIGIFMLVNAPLLALALFRWRWAAIAFVMMLPNILGNIGGAEKTGWSTHYHASYFPALVLAALFGFVALYQWAAASKRALAAYAIIAALVVILSMTNQYSAADPLIGPSNIANDVVFVFPQQAMQWLSPAGLKLWRQGGDVRNAIPEGSTVSSVEAGMSLLYHNRNIQFFPMDIDRANYAVMDITGTVGGRAQLGGAITFLGPEESDKINTLVRVRMRRDGYDFDKAILFPALGIAVVRRGRWPTGVVGERFSTVAVGSAGAKAHPLTHSYPKPSAPATIVQHRATIAAQGLARPTDLTGKLYRKPTTGNIIVAFGSTGFGCKPSAGWTLLGTDPNTVSAVAYRVVRPGDTATYVPFTTPRANGYTLELIEVRGGPDILGSNEVGNGFVQLSKISNRPSLRIPQFGGTLLQLYSGSDGADVTRSATGWRSTVPLGQKQILIERVPRNGNALELIAQATVTDPRRAAQPFTTKQTMTFSDNRSPGNMSAGWLVWVGGVIR